ncbi:MAG: TonB-dependent receptor plug domain-containing protein [Acidobacteriota bacterium]
MNMFYARMLFLFFCFVIFSAPHPLHSANLPSDDEEEKKQVDEPAEEEKPSFTEKIVVVASPIIEGNIVNEYASQVTIVTDEQISDLNAQDLPTALRRAPSIVISRHNPIGSFGGGEGGALFIRGRGSSRPGAEIQTLIDGVPIFVGVWTHPLMDTLSIDTAERIEVYKGAQPILFGNMAFGAVNVITKRMTDDGFSTRLLGAGGSFSTFIETIEHGGKRGPFDYFLIQSYRKSNGHRDNADGELQEYFGSVGLQLSDAWSARLIVNHTDNYANDPGSSDGSIPSDGKFGVSDELAILTLRNAYRYGKGEIKLYWNRGDIDWVDQFNETTGFNDSDTLTDYENYGLRMKESFQLGSGSEIMAGFDLDTVSGKAHFVEPPEPAYDFGSELFRIASPFIAITKSFKTENGWRISPSGGVRFLSHSRLDDDWGYQAGLLFGKGKNDFHASYAHGINFPGLNVVVFDELFLPGDNLWEDLKPEKINHVEAGFGHQFSSRLKADITYFYDRSRNRYVIVPPPPFPPTFENIERSQTSGIEATITVRPNDRCAVFADVTYLSSSPERIPYAPQWTSGIGLNYGFLDRFQLSLDAEYVDEHFVGSQDRLKDSENTASVSSYFLVNGKLSYDFAFPSHPTRAQLYIAVENLTDNSYELKQGYPMPGINGMVGLALDF